jgi:hypothetical protein
MLNAFPIVLITKRHTWITLKFAWHRTWNTWEIKALFKLIFCSRIRTINTTSRKRVCKLVRRWRNISKRSVWSCRKHCRSRSLPCCANSFLLTISQLRPKQAQRQKSKAHWRSVVAQNVCDVIVRQFCSDLAAISFIKMNLVTEKFKST